MDKYGWIVPLKTKTGKEVVQEFRELFHNCHPSRLWADKGTEFYNRHLKAVRDTYHAMLYSTENEEKSSVVKRWNRTMKNIMWKYFTANNTQKYIVHVTHRATNTLHSMLKLENLHLNSMWVIKYA